MGNLIIASDNGLSTGRRQVIIWTNAELLLIRTLGTNFSEILIEGHTFSFNKMHLKMSSAKQRPLCLSLNVLTICIIPMSRNDVKCKYKCIFCCCETGEMLNINNIIHVHVVYKSYLPVAPLWFCWQSNPMEFGLYRSWYSYPLHWLRGKTQCSCVHVWLPNVEGTWEKRHTYGRWETWGLFQYQIRCLIVRSCKVLKSWEWVKCPYCFEICHVAQQQYCWDISQTEGIFQLDLVIEGLWNHPQIIVTGPCWW